MSDSKDDDFYGESYGFNIAYNNLLSVIAPIAERVLPPSSTQTTPLTDAECNAIAQWGNMLLKELDNKRGGE